MAESIGSLRVDIGANTAQFEADMKKARDIVRGTTSEMSRIFGKLGKEFSTIARGLTPLAVGIGAIAAGGAAAAAGLLATTKSLADLGDRLNNAAKSSGITVEQLSFLKAVAEQSGASFDDVTTSLKYLNKNFSDLASGVDKGKGPLQALGITAEQFKAAGEDVNKILPIVIERLGGMKDGADKVKLSLELFGRSGEKLIPALNDIAKNGDALRKKFESLGVILSTEVAEASSKFNSSLDDVRKSIEGVKILIGSGLLPVFTDLFTDLATWISKNRELIKDDVKGFVEGVKVGIENLKIAFTGLPDAISNTNKEFGILTQTIIGLNEIILFAVEGIAAIKTARLGLKQVEELPGDILGLPSSKEFQEQKESLYELDRRIAAMRENLDNFRKTGQSATSALDQFNEASEFLEGVMADATETTSEYVPVLKNLAGGSGKAKDETKKLAEEMKKLGDQAVKGLGDKLRDVQRELASIGASAKELRALEMIALEAKIPWDKLNTEQLAETKRLLAEIGGVLEQIDFKEAVASMTEQVDQFGAEISDSLEGGAEKGREAFDSLGDFIGNVTANISDTIANVLTAAFTGSFEDITNSWKDMLKNLLNIFFQFAASIITNPIRIALEGVLGGGGGAGGGGSGVGAGLGLLGGAGSLFGPSGSFTALGALFTGNSAVGFGATLLGALPAIGMILSAVAIALPLIIDAFKKTPRFAFKFESVETEIGERAAQVSEFLDADFFSDEIFHKIVARGGKGAFSGKELDEMKEAIQKTIAETIKSVQAVINKLPLDMAELLNEELLNTFVDMESKIGRSNLLGFDAKGAKEIKKRLEAFFGGDLQARFLESIRGFFEGAFIQLGALPEKARALIDAQFEAFRNAGSPEARAQIGQELLAQFNAFVDAFNIVEGNVNDAIGQTISTIHNLADSLGFDAIPSIDELRESLREMIKNAEIDPETVQAYADLRNAIVSLALEISNSITSIIGKINQLNTSIAAMGGAAVDTTGWLWDAAGQITDFFQQNMGSLSLSEQEAFLDEIMGIGAELLAQEQAAFAAQQAAMQKAVQAQQAAITRRIEGLNKEKEKINEAFRLRIDALNEELRIAESFRSLTESIRDTLEGIIFSSQSIFTPIEQVNLLMGDIARLQSQLAGAADPEQRLKLAEELQDAFSQLHSTAAEAFGTASPEFHAIFAQVTGGLEALAKMTEERGRTVEQITASIEALTARNEEHLAGIDAKIEKLQSQSQALGQKVAQNTFQASERLRSLFEYIRGEYIRILEARFEQLGEVSESGFATELEGLQALADTAKDQLAAIRNTRRAIEEQTEVLKDVAARLANVTGFQHGSGGYQDFGKGQLAVLHGVERVQTMSEGLGDVRDFGGGGGLRKGEIHVQIDVTGANDRQLNFFAHEVAKDLNSYLQEWVEDGPGREVLDKQYGRRR